MLLSHVEVLAESSFKTTTTRELDWGPLPRIAPGPWPGGGNMQVSFEVTV